MIKLRDYEKEQLQFLLGFMEANNDVFSKNVYEDLLIKAIIRSACEEEEDNG